MAIILAPEGDVHALTVAYEIEENLGGRAVILDTADYPSRWQLSVRIQEGGMSWHITAGDRRIEGATVRGVWWRRVRPHRIEPEITDERVRRFCEDEARATLLGWIYGIGRAVINPLHAERAANQKVFQLVTARQIGLTIPDSLVTNSDGAARSFHQCNESGVIFKAHTGGEFQMLETRKLEAAHLDQLSLLKHAPVIFQRLVPAQADLRVTIVDDEVFSVAIRPQHPGAALDWRLDVAPRYEIYRLPDTVEQQLKLLLRTLGLRYGAIDLRLTPSGEHVFLEVNPGGQFLFVEIQTGLPISRALGAGLLRGAAVNAGLGVPAGRADARPPPPTIGFTAAARVTGQSYR